MLTLQRPGLDLSLLRKNEVEKPNAASGRVDLFQVTVELRRKYPTRRCTARRDVFIPRLLLVQHFRPRQIDPLNDLLGFSIEPIKEGSFCCDSKLCRRLASRARGNAR